MAEPNRLAEWCLVQGQHTVLASINAGRTAGDRRATATAEIELFAGTLTKMVEHDRVDLIGPTLEAYFATPYRIATDTGPLRYYTPRFTRHGADRLTITFADDFKNCGRTLSQLRGLLRIMKLFDATMRSDAVVLGSALLNQWDAGAEPGLAYCANSTSYLLIPDTDFVSTRGYHDFRRELSQLRVPWSERAQIALWRGATTDRFPVPPLTWRDMRRVRLSLIGRAHPDMVDAGITDVHQWDRPELRPMIEAEGLMKPFLPRTDFRRFRYQIDIDGATNAWAGLFTKLLTGSTVLKVESDQNYRQWYYGRMTPWVHYVPVRADMADLLEKISWLRRHDDEAHAIAKRGQALADGMRFGIELVGAVEAINLAFRVYG